MKTSQAKTRVVVKTHGRAKTLPEDRSGEDTRRREDTRRHEGTARRQVRRRHVSSRRHCPKTGQAKKHAVAKTPGRVKTLPDDRSGEVTRRREDTWAGKETSRRRVWSWSMQTSTGVSARDPRPKPDPGSHARRSEAQHVVHTAGCVRNVLSQPDTRGGAGRGFGTWRHWLTWR